MRDNLKKLAEANRKAEGRADEMLTQLVDFPFSWVVALAVTLLAIYGAFKLMM